MQHAQHTVVLPRTEVITRNGLHPLVDAHDDHHEEECQAVDDAVGKDGYMDFSTSASQDYVRTSTTGYIFRKFMDESDNINYVDIESTSYWIEMRYAEIVLILSEAYARLDKFKEAYDYLNKIRTRVGLPILAHQSSSTPPAR